MNQPKCAGSQIDLLPSAAKIGKTGAPGPWARWHCRGRTARRAQRTCPRRHFARVSRNPPARERRRARERRAKARSFQKRGTELLKPQVAGHCVKEAEWPAKHGFAQTASHMLWKKALGTFMFVDGKVSDSMRWPNPPELVHTPGVLRAIVSFATSESYACPINRGCLLNLHKRELDAHW